MHVVGEVDRRRRVDDDELPARQQRLDVGVREAAPVRDRDIAVDGAELGRELRAEGADSGVGVGVVGGW